jgi:AcrR family transcriptional regulator
MRRIPATAVELLAEKSLFESTTREVAQRAGIARRHCSDTSRASRTC